MEAQQNITRRKRFGMDLLQFVDVDDTFYQLVVE
jgi:hypothetical protein